MDRANDVRMFCAVLVQLRHHRAAMERNVIAADAGRAGLIGRIELRQRIVSAIPSAGRARIQALAGISITVGSHP
jgi:hypothetical protein